MSDSLKADIRTAILAEGSLSALIDTRVYQEHAPETAPMPYIIITNPTEEGVYHQTGVSGLALTELEFTIWAVTPESRTAVRNALRDFLNVIIRQTLTSTFCYRIWNTNNIDTKEKPDEGSQNFSFGVIMDFDIWHNR